MKRVELVVTGRVQGVGFRGFVRQRADELGIRGTVRNTPAGDLEVVGEGTPEALAEFVREVRRGPMRARVEQVSEQWSEGAPAHRRFEITG